MADDRPDDGGDGDITGTMVGGVLGGCIVASGLAAVLIMAKAKKTEKNVRNASDPAVDNPTYVDTPAVIHKKQNPVYVGSDGGLGGSGYLEVEG